MSKVAVSCASPNQPPVSGSSNLWYNLLVAAAFLTQIFLLVIVGWLNREAINPDAVSYIHIAKHFLNGHADVMISGYWGPMLSWVMVPWLGLFDDLLLAVRVAMGISAVIFLFGSWCVLRVVGLPACAVVIGLWITALVSVRWSIRVISPDLLLAGTLCWGVSLMIGRQWASSVKTALGAGLVFGISYLVKAVAFPVSGLIIVGLAASHLVVGERSLRQIVRATIFTFAGLLLIAGPWIGILSYKYERLVFSTSGPINHALVGPPDTDRFHPGFRLFHKPEIGRLNSWEDPTNMPYVFWFPFESREYAVHQAKLVYRNVQKIVLHLTNFDWLGLGLVSAILGYVFGGPWAKGVGQERWRWSLIPIVCVGTVYLPVYASDVRYYWVVFPFLLAASLGFVQSISLSAATVKNQKIMPVLALILVSLSFVMGNQVELRNAFHPIPNQDYVDAKMLASVLNAAEFNGPIASIGDHQIGYYLSYLLQMPWFGQMLDVRDVEEILESDAALIIVPQETALSLQLRDHIRFSRVDEAWVRGNLEARPFPFEVYYLKRAK